MRRLFEWSFRLEEKVQETKVRGEAMRVEKL